VLFFISFTDIQTCAPFFSCFSIQSRFADALLQELAGLKIPPERIYGLGTGLVHVN